MPCEGLRGRSAAGHAHVPETLVYRAPPPPPRRLGGIHPRTGNHEGPDAGIPRRGRGGDQRGRGERGRPMTPTLERLPTADPTPEEKARMATEVSNRALLRYLHRRRAWELWEAPHEG